MSPLETDPGASAAALRWREIEGPWPDLVELCGALRAEACPWLLDSAMQDARLGRFSFAGADAPIVVRVRGECVELHCRRPTLPGLEVGFHATLGDPLETLRSLLPRARHGSVQAPPNLPFVGGAVGYLGYELAGSIESVTLRTREGLGFPEATLLFVDRLVALDHASSRAFALGWGFASDAGKATRRAEASLAVVCEWIARLPTRDPVHAVRRKHLPDLARRRALLAARLPESARSSLERSSHASHVRGIIDEIEAGNVYETNLTQRISLPFDGDSFALYRALRRESPAPFACFIDLPEGAILSSSPERFLRLGHDGAVESRPIKGTRPRGATPEEDDALARELVGSEKDRAENLMIVDLVRNDLGRVCETGSIAVPELMVVEAYAGLFQLVSTVTGQLGRNRDAVDLLRATFPPGSMTGAPKIAAMQLIDRVEPVRRGVYSGAIGYFDVRGGFDLSVVIRTLLVEKGQAHVHVGGAIVADSIADAEYLECLVKARPLVAAWQAVHEPCPEAGRHRSPSA